MKRLLLGAACLSLVACSTAPSVTDNVGQRFTIEPRSVVIESEADPGGVKLKAAKEGVADTKESIANCRSGLPAASCNRIYKESLDSAQKNLDLWTWLSGEKEKVRKVTFRYILTNVAGQKTPSEQLEAVCLAKGVKVPEKVKKQFDEYRDIPSIWGTTETERLKGMACETYAKFPSAK